MPARKKAGVKGEGRRAATTARAAGELVSGVGQGPAAPADPAECAYCKWFEYLDRRMGRCHLRPPFEPVRPVDFCSYFERKVA